MSRLIFCTTLLLFLSTTAAQSVGDELTVRLRFAWGSGTVAKQRWTGMISVDGGVLTQLQPLGIESDASVACRIDGSRLLVNPLIKRGFDGCDVTIRADEQALVRVDLNNEQNPQGTSFEAPLSEVIARQLQQPLDELGSFFLARRSPGDVLRVLPTREHFVFSPGEKWQLKLQPDLEAQLANGPIVLDVRLRASGEEKSSWQSSQQITEVAQLAEAVNFEITCPATEGAYRITATARPQESLATRFVPGQQAKPIAQRDIEFVVIDPEAKLTPLVDHWLPVLTIDPANPSWWQRLPAWAQVPRLRGLTPGAVGNVRPVVRPTSTGELMELPPAPSTGEPYWQSYTLPVREPGKPHLIELEYPSGVEQTLDIALVEPDASGKVTSTTQDASLQCDGFAKAADGTTAIHRFVVWPKTRSPQLLIVNRNRKATGQYGKIRLLRQDSALASLTEQQPENANERMLAGYISKPSFAGNFGSAEMLDPESGLSIQGWATFLDGTRRLAQSLKFGGYNSLMISVAADGSGLYPSPLLNPSPRYDTGLLAANGQDPTKKDVLEMVFRVFDREGIRIIPALQLAAPLPRLEPYRQGQDATQSGIACLDHNGQSVWSHSPNDAGLRSIYNPLNASVQAELVALVRELTVRYANHSSFAGVGVQVTGEGYGLMPGLACGFDDRTMTEFARATNLSPLPSGVDRFRQRAILLLGEHREQWKRWRQDRLSELYHQLAKEVTNSRSDLSLTIATDELFAGTQLRQRVRRAIDDPLEFSSILPDHALDLSRLASNPAIKVLLPHSLATASTGQGDAIQLRTNTAVEQDELIAADRPHGELFHSIAERFRLPSFDAQSPFGSNLTFLTVSSRQARTGRDDRGQLMKVLAAADTSLIVEGGQGLSLSRSAKSRDVVHALRQLPSDAAAREQREQPVTLRVYRTEDTTTVCLINESPWPTAVSFELKSSQESEWRKLGSGLVDEASQLTGTLTGTNQTWSVELQPHDLQAWRFQDAQLRVSDLSVEVAELAKTQLQQRIREIESRAGNLSMERSYPQLQNPGFELQDGGVRIVGWQPRQGAIGSIGLDDTKARSGTHALRLKSEDLTGVAVQSHLFPAPDTGQLTVSAFFRVEHVEPNTQLRIVVQDQFGGHEYQQMAALTGEQLKGDAWTLYEMPLNDVPRGKENQLRLHFHLSGDAEVLVDDVELLDLRFDESRRRTLVKRIHGASIALEQGQLVDCLRVVDDYWSRYLLEHVPAAQTVENLAAKQSAVESPTEATPSEAEKGLGSRVRGWVPKLWR